MLIRYWREIAGGLAVLALVALAVSWRTRGAEIERLDSWRATVVQSATDATVEPDKNGRRKTLAPEQVPAAIAALKRSADSAAQTLAGIDRAAKSEGALSDKLDEGLTAALAEQDRRAAASLAAIRELAARKASGDPATDCATIAEDSKDAWSGWRK